MLTRNEFRTKGIKLFKEAATTIPNEIKKRIKSAYQSESKEIAKMQLKNILDNIELAENLERPLCQDTGIPIFFIETGKKINFKAMEKGLIDAIVEATETVPLRPNVVHPLTRRNTGNTGDHVPIFHYDFIDENVLRITLLMKGAGSENMSRMQMMNPSDNMKDITSFIVETVRRAGGNPCPPTIVGVGIGGSADYAPLLAKKALLKEENSKIEEEILKKINGLGIGPMGLGGKTTSLKVSIKTASCHTASLPVAVNLQCWAHRVASVVL
ncbi:MAG: fumarate hydratase [Euryarchaeota archaeon]|nr:fumarate hydratase [Euryarchaeota archaeon]